MFPQNHLEEMHQKIDCLFEKLGVQLPGKPKKDPEMLTIKQVTSIFGISARALWDWRDLEKIKDIRVGRRVFFNRSEIEKLIEEEGVKQA